MFFHKCTACGNAPACQRWGAAAARRFPAAFAGKALPVFAPPAFGEGGRKFSLTGGRRAAIIAHNSKGVVVWTTAPLSIFLSNTVKRYEEEEYRGKPAAATGGGWKPRARGRGKNTSEREPERMAPVGGTGCDRYIAPACPSRKRGRRPAAN